MQEPQAQEAQAAQLVDDLAASDGGSPGGGAPAAQRKKRHWVRTILVMFLALALGLVGFYYSWTQQQLNNVVRDVSLDPPEYEGRAEPTPALNILVIGSDKKRPKDKSSDPGGRSDVLILAHVSPARDRVYLISFSRGTYAHIPGVGMNRINAAYQDGGGALAARTVEEFLGIRVDHVAEVDFDGFIGLTKTLGGVSVYNRVASSSEGYSWPKGQITVKGDGALAYVRQRYNIELGDLVRAERARSVTKAIVMKLLQPENIADPLRYAQLSSTIAKFVTLDSAFTNEFALSTALSLKIDSSDDIRMLQIPLTGWTHIAIPGDPALEVFLPNKAQVAELGSALTTDGMDAYYEKYKNQPYIS